jgi:uncharacterized protein
MEKPSPIALFSNDLMANDAPFVWLARCAGVLILVSLVASFLASSEPVSCSAKSYGGMQLCSDQSLDLLDRSLEAEFLVATTKHPPAASMIARQFMQAHERCGPDLQCIRTLKASTSWQLDAIFGGAPVGPIS